MNARKWAAVVVAVLIAGIGSLPADHHENKHMKVGDPTATCDACHREMTPEVVEEWFAGPHGKFNVKCFVCHGSTGDDFVRVPAMDRCVGCHADNVASMSGKRFEGMNCFSCHPGHALNPHRVADKGGK